MLFHVNFTCVILTTSRNDNIGLVIKSCIVSLKIFHNIYKICMRGKKVYDKYAKNNQYSSNQWIVSVL